MNIPQDLRQIAAYINDSQTGSVATVMGDHVSVKVPGLQSSGNKVERFYSTEKIRSMRSARGLINSMI